MKERERFINELNRYYEYLTTRFTNGSNYVDSRPDDIKSYIAYENIITELSHVEKLVNYFLSAKLIKRKY